MAYIPYSQSSGGGRQLATAMADLLAVADKLRNITNWIAEIGVGNLETNTDFAVGAGSAQAFSDTLTQISTDLNTTFMGTNRVKISRLARGS